MRAWKDLPQPNNSKYAIIHESICRQCISCGPVHHCFECSPPLHLAIYMLSCLELRPILDGNVDWHHHWSIVKLFVEAWKWDDLLLSLVSVLFSVSKMLYSVNSEPLILTDLLLSLESYDMKLELEDWLWESFPPLEDVLEGFLEATAAFPSARVSI